MMLPQRVRAGESRVKNKSSNGPLRAQSNVGTQSILRREADVTCRGYDGIPLSVRTFRKSRWHRGLKIIRP